MRLALAQINTTVGDLDGNRERILAGSPRRGAPAPTSSSSPSSRSPATRPRTCCCGPASSARPRSRCARSRARRTGIVALVGFPHFDRDLYNACAVCADGEVKAVYRKRFLPNYGVFDEDRYFAPGRDLLLLELGGTLVGPTICEDIWQPGPPATDLALAGAQLLVEHLGLAVPRRPRPRARGDVRHARARQRLLRRVLQRRRRAGRADLRRPLAGARRGGRRARARARASRRRCSSSTSTPPTRSGGGCATCAGARSRASAAPRRRSRSCTSATAARARRPDRAARRRSALGELEQMRLALELGLRDYVEQERLQRGRRRRLRRDRLGADRRARRRGARRRARALRLDAVALLVRGDARATRGGSPRASAPTSASCRSSAIVEAFDAIARRELRRAASPTSPRRTCRRGSAACC